MKPASGPAAAVARPAPAPVRQRAAAPHALAAAGVPRYLHGATAADPQVGQATAAARSGGEPLPEAQRMAFEAGLQGDFSAVRIHAGPAAAEAARGVQARAYTVGHDIVFGSGEFAPEQPAGRRLLAHELVHVTQQAHSGVAMQRDDLPGTAPVPLAATGLAAESEATRKSLQFDTDQSDADFAVIFDLAGTPVTADNVDDSFELEAPTITAIKDDKVRSKLYTGLRNYARGIFDLWPATEGKQTGKATTTRLNLVHIENMDLGPWNGPNAAFRFTSIGAVKKGQITVRILIEELPLQVPLAAAGQAQGIETRTLAPQGLTRDATVNDVLWARLVRGLGQIDTALLGRVRDLSFAASTSHHGPAGEAAKFSDALAKGASAWTRRITVYQKMVDADDAVFAFTLAHEIAHAVDDAPTEGAKGRVNGAAVHELAGFIAAAKKDGGRKGAVTDYGKTSDSEFFAECSAMYLRQPQSLALLRPNIHAWFEAFAHPPAAAGP